MPRTVPPVVPPGALRDARQPRLEGDRVALRPWDSGDAEMLRRAFRDPEIRRWHMRQLDGPGDADAWIASWSERWTAETDGSWAALDPESGEAAGQVGLRQITLEFGVAHVSYWTSPAFRGRGLAARAAQVVADWALGDLGLHRLEVHHSTANSESCRVAERAGFAAEGLLHSALLHDDGWHDMHVHARIAAD